MTTTTCEFLKDLYFMCENSDFFSRYKSQEEKKGHCQISFKKQDKSFLNLSLTERDNLESIITEVKGVLNAEYKPISYEIIFHEGLKHNYIDIIPRHKDI